MRLMSFMLTPEQVVNGSKDVTRRTKWLGLKPGTRLQAVRKAQGGIRKPLLSPCRADEARRHQ